MQKIIFCIFMIIFFSGCETTFESRKSNIDSFNNTLKIETERILEKYNGILSLSVCKKIALERNLNFKATKLESKIAKFNKNIAFSVFLPKIEYSYTKNIVSKDVAMWVRGGVMETRDKNLTLNAINMHIPIFTPYSWLIYKSMSNVKKIKELTIELTSQLIDFNVTTLYYQILILNQEFEILKSELKWSEALYSDLNAMMKEGYVLETDVEDINILKKNNLMLLKQITDSLIYLKSEFLNILGLYPLSKLKITKPDNIISFDNIKKQELSKWVYEALLNRKELHIQDQNIAINKNIFLQAITQFLPNIIGFNNYNDTSDSHTVNTKYWISGFSGVITLFNGFATIANYHKAKVKQEKSFIEREETTLMIILQVVKAFVTMEKTRDRFEISKNNFDNNSIKYKIAEAKYKEGLLSFTQFYEAKKRYKKALSQKIISEYLHAISVHSFLNTIGKNDFIPENIKRK